MCAVIPKNGDAKAIAFMSPNEFWQEVKGKSYKVAIDDDKYEIDRWHRKCTGRSVADIVEEIFKALDEERYSDVKGMTKPKTLYVLKEV